ncbi:hypothetical protein ACQUW0_27780 [Ralstonia pseudosolanacearum]|uniref:hypothetical protein n=1 Tax=Ralstonia pseudosolanacearum TaxID=1310165 RepID=UPI003D179FDF
MFPLIMMALQAAKQKAASENQDLQNLQNNMQTPIQVQQQPQFPTINSVFGNR